MESPVKLGGRRPRRAHRPRRRPSARSVKPVDYGAEQDGGGLFSSCFGNKCEVEEYLPTNRLSKMNPPGTSTPLHTARPSSRRSQSYKPSAARPTEATRPTEAATSSRTSVKKLSTEGIINAYMVQLGAVESRVKEIIDNIEQIKKTTNDATKRMLIGKLQILLNGTYVLSPAFLQTLLSRVILNKMNPDEFNLTKSFASKANRRLETILNTIASFTPKMKVSFEKNNKDNYRLNKNLLASLNNLLQNPPKNPLEQNDALLAIGAITSYDETELMAELDKPPGQAPSQSSPGTSSRKTGGRKKAAKATRVKRI